jgi:hypothetical protein
MMSIKQKTKDECIELLEDFLDGHERLLDWYWTNTEEEKVQIAYEIDLLECIIRIVKDTKPEGLLNGVA